MFEKKPKLSASKTKKREIPSGLWVKCEDCGEMIFSKELAANLKVCPKCDRHFPMTAHERIGMLTDPGSFRESDRDMISVDVLNFTGPSAYAERLDAYRRETNLPDAVVTGLCRICGHEGSLAVVGFSFLGSGMGSVVGGEITRTVETAT
ncbi:MAG: acetyl-CoA carboxylase carboxyl transferase subunit beta, partial [Verrucomicrobiae bacterium]|nr:acetyl-CoA carboxylase carboxyl transferase subunit beta [Verrucomicrobiae bacterium]